MRAKQIWKSYAEIKQEPAIGENMERPRKPFDEQEAEVIGEANKLYRFGARMLETVVRKVFKSDPKYYISDRERTREALRLHNHGVVLGRIRPL
jgi:hypothetical protein